MGCDIHYVVEKKIDAEWVGIFKKWPRSGFAGERDYEFFTEIAAVRGRSDTAKYPQFLPKGISRLALHEIIHDGTDGHSHSWMPIKEFSEIALRVNPDKFPTPYDKEQPWEKLFGEPIFLNTDDDKIEDYRIVFWFDN
jgi:hypothetical protein